MTAQAASLLALLILFILLAGIFTYPLIVKPFTHIPSFTLGGKISPEGTESYVNIDFIIDVWYWWNIKEHWFSEKSRVDCLWETDLFYAPEGLDLWVNLSNPLPLILLFPFPGSLGAPGNVNIYVLAILVFNGIFTCFMLKRLGLSRHAALLGGALVTLNPYYFVTAASGRGEQALVWFTLLFIPAGLEALVRGGRGKTLTAAGLLLAASLAYWFHGLFLGIFLFLAMALAVRRAPRGQKLLPIRRTMVILLLLVCFSLPFLYPHLRDGLNQGQVLGVTKSTIIPLSFPPRTESRESISDSEAGAHVIAAHPPGRILKNPVVLFQLLLILPLLLFSRRRPVLWIGTAVLFYVLSLGPYLSLGGSQSGIPLPFALFYACIPFFNRLLDAGRFTAFTYIALAVISAYSCDFISRKLRLRATPAWCILIILLAAVVALARAGGEINILPYPAIPRAVRELKGKQGGVINVPVFSNQVSTRSMWLQTAHGLPMLNGPGADMWFMRPARWNTLVEESSLLTYLSRFGSDKESSYNPSPDQVRDLRDRGFRFIFHHKLDKLFAGNSALGGGMKQTDSKIRRFHLSIKLSKVLGMSPIYKSDSLDIYDLSPAD